MLPVNNLKFEHFDDFRSVFTDLTHLGERNHEILKFNRDGIPYTTGKPLFFNLSRRLKAIYRLNPYEQSAATYFGRMVEIFAQNQEHIQSFLTTHRGKKCFEENVKRLFALAAQKAPTLVRRIMDVNAEISVQLEKSVLLHEQKKFEQEMEVRKKLLWKTERNLILRGEQILKLEKTCCQHIEEAHVENDEKMKALWDDTLKRCQQRIESTELKCLELLGEIDAVKESSLQALREAYTQGRNKDEAERAKHAALLINLRESYLRKELDFTFLCPKDNHPQDYEVIETSSFYLKKYTEWWKEYDNFIHRGVAPEERIDSTTKVITGKAPPIPIRTGHSYAVVEFYSSAIQAFLAIVQEDCDIQRYAQLFPDSNRPEPPTLSDIQGEDQFYELYRVADYFRAESIKNYVLQHIKSFVKYNRALSLAVYSDLDEKDPLMQHLCDTIAHNLDPINKLDKFNLFSFLSHRFILELLKRETIAIESEDALLTLILDWADHYTRTYLPTSESEPNSLTAQEVLALPLSIGNTKVAINDLIRLEHIDLQKFKGLFSEEPKIMNKRPLRGNIVIAVLESSDFYINYEIKIYGFKHHWKRVKEGHPIPIPPFNIGEHQGKVSFNVSLADNGTTIEIQHIHKSQNSFELSRLLLGGCTVTGNPNVENSSIKYLLATSIFDSTFKNHDQLDLSVTLLKK